MHLPDCITRWLFNRATTLVERRHVPDITIGAPHDVYLRRWWILPRNRVFNIYLHQFSRSDDDRALHDHPWLFNATIMLRGGYIEHTIARGGIHHQRRVTEGQVLLRTGRAPHRLQLHPWGDGPNEASCITLFITGPVIRHWGFHCPQTGWVPWAKFTKNNGAETGQGCDQ